MNNESKRYLPVVGALVAVLALLTIFNDSTPNSLPNLKLTALVAGDNLFSDTPQKGYLYSCQSDFSGRSLRAGSWFNRNTKYFNLKEKPTVSGAVEWDNSVQKSQTGNKRIIATNAVPPHATGEFPPAEKDDAYQYYPSEDAIKEQNLFYGLTQTPIFSDKPECVGEEVGVSLTGIPLYSPLNDAGDDAVAHEMLDSCGGRPDAAGVYHYYHLTDCWRGEQATTGPSVVGYALDGFPIVDGLTVDNSNLDVCHGQVGKLTLDGEEKESYYYVATADFPYLVGCFRGEAVAGPTVPLRQRARIAEATIPQYYHSQDKLLLPYLDELNGGESASKPFEWKWEKWLPAFSQ